MRYNILGMTSKYKVLRIQKKEEGFQNIRKNKQSVTNMITNVLIVIDFDLMDNKNCL